MRVSISSSTNLQAFRLWIAAAWVCGLLAPGGARAHFLWMTSDGETKPPSVHAFLSETPTPEGPELLKSIAKAEITAEGRSLSWTKGADTYRVTLPELASKTVDGFCDMGVMNRKGVRFRLLYTARLQFGASASDAAEDGDHLRLRLVDRADKTLIVQVTFRGKAAVGAVVKAFPEEGDPVDLKADAEGRLEYALAAEGKAGLLAKWTETVPGMSDGKSFDEVRYYATLTIAPAKPVDPVVKTASAPLATTAPFALLPEAINSFGGAVSDGWLYVYSGHTGDTHKYSSATTTAHFRRLDLANRSTWEELPCGPALQGVALVAHGGMLYRIGGASAKNPPGTPDDLASVADFARFDPRAKTWVELPKLPSARSTHDAVVADDKIYVIGGWTMNGGAAANSEFSEDALVFDLSRQDAQWEKLPDPPFRRRALAVAENAGKIYVLGGLTDAGKVVKTVDIYDPSTKAWSTGPEMLGSHLQRFAPSAFGVGGRLFVSGQDGVLLRLSADGQTWETAGKLAMPRLTHRLLPGVANDLLAVGGNFADAPIRVIESLPLTEVPGPKALTWSIPIASEARQGQAIALVRSKLLAVGGNRASEPHAFQAANLVREGVEVSLGRMDARPIDPLPELRQSASLVTVPSRQGEAFLLGGIGPDGDLSRTLGEVFKLDVASGSWTKLNASIPDARGLFGTAVYKDAIYLFGGSVWDPRPGHDLRRMPVEVLRWETSSEGSTFQGTGRMAPRSRRSFAGATLGSKYYMVGGIDDSMKLVETVDVFDFEANTWSTIATPRSPRLFAGLAALDGKLYLAGGFTKSKGGHFEATHSIEVFEPATGKWATLLETSPLDAPGVAMLPIQGRLLLYAPDERGGREAHFAILAP